MSVPFDVIDHLQLDGQAVIRLATELDPGTPIDTCPGWTITDLAWHLGRVWGRFAHIVANRVTDPGDPTPDGPERPADHGLLLDSVTTSQNAIISALSDAPDDTPLLTFAGLVDAEWIGRRLVHETAVHRWDAERVAGRPYRIPTAVAADGIDEYLDVILRRRRDPLPGSVHLHCTDTDSDRNEGSDDIAAVGGEWLVRPAGDDFELTREHAKGDAAVRGRADDIVLWLWGRPTEVEILGDPAAAESLRMS